MRFMLIPETPADYLLDSQEKAARDFLSTREGEFQRGLRFGYIKVLRELLGEAPMPEQELMRLSLETLDFMSASLEYKLKCTRKESSSGIRNQ